MSLQVGIVGLPGAGKTTLFRALTHAGTGHSGHVGVAAVPDERLGRLAEVVGSKKVTPAAIRLLDVPGRSAEVPGELRQADALLAVLDGYSGASDPEADLESLRLELVVADRDHVARRLERVRREAKSGERGKRLEVDLLERVLQHLDAGHPLSEWDGEFPPALDPLTTKPLLPVENGPGGIDGKLELELTELPPEEAAEFRTGPSALDDVVVRLKGALRLISFFTLNEAEAHAWTLRRGQTALEAAAAVHTDLARGFIRCEVIRWDDLLACGSHAEARKRGLERLEGKGYVIEDGDVLYVRFNV